MKTKFTILSFIALFPVGLVGTYAGPAAPAAQPDSGPDGARLWAQTCMRCHNSRPQASYGPGQWEAIVHHMKVKAYMTGTEARAIADFLKGAN
jgi:mono/diheme cytochrome c family protein